MPLVAGWRILKLTVFLNHRIIREEGACNNPCSEILKNNLGVASKLNGGHTEDVISRA